MNWLYAALAAYALAGFVAGVSLGAEWLASVNSAGFPAGAMLVPAFTLPLCGAALRLGRPKAVDSRLFYSRLSWAMLAGGMAWSRVGWRGRLGDAEPVAWIADVGAVLILPTAALALIAARRVADHSANFVIRWSLRGVVAAVIAVGAYCWAWVLVGSFHLSPPAAALVGAVTLGAVSLTATAVTFQLPHRSRTHEWSRS